MRTKLNAAMIEIREALAQADSHGIQKVSSLSNGGGTLTLIAIIAGPLSTAETTLLKTLGLAVVDEAPLETEPATDAVEANLATGAT